MRRRSFPFRAGSGPDQAQSLQILCTWTSTQMPFVEGFRNDQIGGFAANAGNCIKSSTRSECGRRTVSDASGSCVSIGLGSVESNRINQLLQVLT